MVAVVGIIINVVFGIRISGVGVGGIVAFEIIAVLVVIIVNCEGITLLGRTLSGVRVLDTAVGTIVV